MWLIQVVEHFIEKQNLISRNYLYSLLPLLTFKHMDNQIFHPQNRFIWEKQRIAIRLMHSDGKPKMNPEERKRGNF